MNARTSLTLSLWTILLSICLLGWWVATSTVSHWETASESKLALQMITQARAYPHTSVPMKGLTAAFEQHRHRMQSRSGAIDVGPWEAMGPTNIAGRTLALGLNPMGSSTLWAGSASGGLWRSRSGGLQPDWERIRTGFPVLAVSSITFEPRDSNVLYIGTGEMYGSAESQPGITGERLTRGSYGIGILKSVDGGVSWHKSLDWSLAQNRGIQDVRVDPQRPQVVWAATSIGVLKTTNGGMDWSLSLDVAMATDVSIHFTHPDTLLVACGGMGSAGRGIYRTLDGGQSWSQLSLGEGIDFQGKIRLARSASHPDIVYASVGRSNGSLIHQELGTWLLQTVDNGDHWTIQSTLDYARVQGWYAHDVAVHPENPSKLWAAGQSFSPLQSDSAGIDLHFVADTVTFVSDQYTLGAGLRGTWADYHVIRYHPTNPKIIYFANDGGIFRTSDGGKTVRNCNVGYQTTQFYNGVSSHRQDSLFMIGGLQDNNTLQYLGHPFWQRVGCCDGSWTAVNQTDPSDFYTSSQFLRIVALQAGKVFSPDDPSQVNFIAPFVLSHADNATLYAGGTKIYRSRDKGQHWEVVNDAKPLDGNPAIAMAASEQSVDRVYVATSAAAVRPQLFTTGDGGEHWVNITGDLPDRIMTDIALDPADDQRIYVTLGGFGSSHLYHSPDGGASWFDVGVGLPDVPTWAVLVDPHAPDFIYVGNELGVYVSSDGGLCWEPHGVGLTDAVMAMDLVVSRSNRMLFLATHGNGTFRSRLPEVLPTAAQGVDVESWQFRLFPNPVSEMATFTFHLPRAAWSKLTLYDVEGQRIQVLFEGKAAAGAHVIHWDRTSNFAGQLVLCQLQVDGEVATKTLLLMP